jgi:hypothetical protein
MKTKYLTFIVLILLSSACKNSSQKSDSNSIQIDANTENKMEQNSLVNFGAKYANAWSSQKPERVAEFFASDASLQVNDGEPAVGTEAITNVAKGFMDAFPDMIVSMDSLVTKSNKTRFYWTLTGTNSVPGGTGNKVKISGFEEWTVNKEGLVQESKGHFNAEEYNRQLNGDTAE